MSVSALLHRKEQLEQDLRNVEKQIYDLEGSYLEETGNYGNILQGWSGFMAIHPKNYQSAPKRVKESDRAFSLSSVTSPQSAEMLGSYIDEKGRIQGVEPAYGKGQRKSARGKVTQLGKRGGKFTGNQGAGRQKRSYANSDSDEDYEQ